MSSYFFMLFWMSVVFLLTSETTINFSPKFEIVIDNPLKGFAFCLIVLGIALFDMSADFKREKDLEKLKEKYENVKSYTQNLN